MGRCPLSTTWFHKSDEAATRRKEEQLAYALGVLVPGGGQLYAEDWAIGIYLAGLGFLAGFVWGLDQAVVAVLMWAVAYLGGLVLVPHSLRKGRPPGLAEPDDAQ